MSAKVKIPRQTMFCWRTWCWTGPEESLLDDKRVFIMPFDGELTAFSFPPDGCYPVRTEALLRVTSALWPPAWLTEFLCSKGGEGCCWMLWSLSVEMDCVAALRFFPKTFSTIRCVGQHPLFFYFKRPLLKKVPLFWCKIGFLVLSHTINRACIANNDPFI